MKLSVLQENLLEHISLASRFISPRAQVPVLSNILLSAKNGKLKVAATNLETGISTFLGAKIEKEGEITIPARIFLDLISTLTPGKIFLEEERGHLKISNASFLGNISGIAASEFPKVPEELKEKTISLSKAVLASLTNQVSFACATDETRPVLTGILILINEKLQAVATDGFRLSFKEISIDKEFSLKQKNKDSLKMLFPARVVDELAKINQAEAIDVLVLEKEGQILFGSGDQVLTSRFIEGEFPAYEKVIPTSWNTKVLTGREDLARAVRTASVFAKDTSSIIKIKTGDGNLTFSSESNQYGKEEVVIEAKLEGEPLETAFNYKFLLDFVNSAEGDSISFEIQGSTSPGVFQDVKDTSYKHIIMPVRIQPTSE